MPITDFKIDGYRSIRSVWLKLKPINVIVGPNGCGKSNMYRAMYLVACAASGEFARAIAEEGGINSVLWAGGRSKREMKKRQRMSLSVRVGKFEYNLACGVIGELRGGIFFSDPEIKAEDVFYIHDGHKRDLLKRRRGTVFAKDSDGKRLDYTLKVPDNESVLTNLREPYKFPELFALRQELLDWRFYHHFRTDSESPLRKPQLGVMTPIMRHDGLDLAAALQTIRESEDMARPFANALEDAFPGSELLIKRVSRDKLKLLMVSPGFNRPFEAAELSDGTLQYLCLLAALLSPRPPAVLALNEPETSIHPDLYEPLARLIIAASAHSQIWITTHATQLSDLILELSGYEPLELEKVNGETKLVGVGLGGYKEDDDEYVDDEESTEIESESD